MVTMQKRGEPSVQTFALPLTQVGSDAEMKDPESNSKVRTFFRLFIKNEL